MKQSQDELHNEFLTRRLKVAELRDSGAEISEIAIDLGIPEKAVLDQLKKVREVEISENFQQSSGLLTGTVRTLKEYYGFDTCAHTNRDWDNISPDVVVCGSNVIGLELTAYGNQLENQVYDVRYQVSRHAREVLKIHYPSLQGYTVFWKPDYQNPVPKSKIAAFAKELLTFVSDQFQEESLEIEQWREFPIEFDQTVEQVFGKWNLLKRHTLAVKVFRARYLGDLPVSVSLGSHTTYRTTRIETLVDSIGKKIRAFKSAHRIGIDSHWLLIHAARALISSDNYPLFPQEIERLLASEAAEMARQSDFDRVILWDGVDGGYVDLKHGDAVPVGA